MPRRSREYGTGEGKWLDSECGIGQNFGGGGRAQVPSLPVDDPLTSDQNGVYSAYTPSPLTLSFAMCKPPCQRYDRVSAHVTGVASASGLRLFALSRLPGFSYGILERRHQRGGGYANHQHTVDGLQRAEHFVRLGHDDIPVAERREVHRGMIKGFAEGLEFTLAAGTTTPRSRPVPGYRSPVTASPYSPPRGSTRMRGCRSASR